MLENRRLFLAKNPWIGLEFKVKVKSYDRVKLGYSTVSDDYYAIKIINPTTDFGNNLRAILNETSVLKKLDHKNILKVYKVSSKGVETKADGKVKEG